MSGEIGVPLLATIPIQPEVSAGGDSGHPASVGEGRAAAAFAQLVDSVLEVAPVVDVTDCTARILDDVRRRLDEADGDDA